MTHCAHHPSDTAKWSCNFCDELLCQGCVVSRAFKGDEIHVCKECGGRATALAGFDDKTAEEPDTKQTRMTTECVECSMSEQPAGASGETRLDRLKRAIDLPFLWSGEGVVLLPILAGISLFMGIAQPVLASNMALLLWFLIAELTLYAWVLGIGLDILRTSFEGGDQLTFKDHVIAGDRLWRHREQWVIMFLIGLGPVHVYSRYYMDSLQDIPIFLLALFWKDLYLTLALPAYAWSTTWASILPTTCLRDAFRMGSPFLFLLTACFGLSLFTYILTDLLWIWNGEILAIAQSQLLLCVAFLLKMRWIGNFYRRHMPQLGWL